MLQEVHFEDIGRQLQDCSLESGGMLGAILS